MSTESMMPPTILSSATLFFYLQSFPASGAFPVSWLFQSGGQSTGASASALVLPMNIHDWFPLELTGLISLQSKWFSRIFSSSTILKASILQHSAFFMVQFSHQYMTNGKIIAFSMWIFVGKVMSLLLSTLSGSVIASLARSKSINILGIFLTDTHRTLTNY